MYDSVPRITRRLLINPGNLCYLNSILYPLLYCVPFHNLFKVLKKKLKSKVSDHSIVESLIQFIDEFASPNIKSPFEPSLVCNALFDSLDSKLVAGCQEDASEFLGYLLDGLHRELKSKVKPESGDWIEIGKKMKKTNVRRVEAEKSLISELFFGKFKTSFKCSHMKASIIEEPFMLLPLDIQDDSIISILDAIEQMQKPETIDEYHLNGGEVVNATKVTEIKLLPQILVCNIKRAILENSEIKKSHKFIHYGHKIHLNGVEYNLFAVVYHHGSSLESGHYTCNVYDSEMQEWLYIDDGFINIVHSDHVLREKSASTYLLFYQRVQG